LSRSDFQVGFFHGRSNQIPAVFAAVRPIFRFRQSSNYYFGN